jgi:ubiquinone/menaquinone biosynthesis C-methylase UbiE
MGREAVKRSLVRNGVPAALAAVALRRSAPRRVRQGAVLGLVGLWTAVYARYRRTSLEETDREFELLRTANWEAFTRHYNEQVPTIEEEFELWGEFHQHRHEMRYDLVAADVRRHTPAGGTILDIGCGSGLVADRVLDLDATYVGLDLPAHHITYVAKRFRDIKSRLHTAFVRGDGERLPLRDASVDVVVLSEVIEHLLQPERAVWEISRVLRPGGVLVMTTNNASEMPLRSPLSHLFAWAEKAIGADVPWLISRRPWVWPVPVDPALLPPGSAPVYLPHTHHIQAQTRAMFRAAGLDTFEWSTFEFPPPQAKTTAWLESKGDAGKRVVDLIEAVATRVPALRRLGCHVFMRARKVGSPVAPTPPVGVWPGPFSGADIH